MVNNRFNSIEMEPAKKPYIDHKGLLSHPFPFFFPADLKSNGSNEDKKTILLVENNQRTEEGYKCLSVLEDWEVINASKSSRLHQLIMPLKPDLIILTLLSESADGLETVKEIREKSNAGDIPIIFFTTEKPTAQYLEMMQSIGAIDCLNHSMEINEMKLRINAAINISEMRSEYREREEKILREHEKLNNTFDQLKSEISKKQREYLAQLELLIYSKEVNESLVDKILCLKPYLNQEGKTKLNFLAKQIKWEIKDEEHLNLERKLDNSNFAFYKLLEDRSPDLTRYEKRLCAYFRTSHSSAEIARLTRRNPNCINVAFARIRAKLSMRDSKELKVFLNELHNQLKNVSLSYFNEVSV